MDGKPKDQKPWWDEHRWERFMDEQEQKSEKYLKLLEKYGDPDHKELLLEELNVAGAAGEAGETDADQLEFFLVDDDFDDDSDISEEVLDRDNVNRSQLEANPAYRKAHQFCTEIHQRLREENGEKSPRPIVDLLNHAYCIPAKIAGGMGGNNTADHLGMTIAYCKRGLQESHQCLSALAEIEEKRLLNKDEVAYLRQLALEVREELVTQIAGFRDSWRKRYGLG